MLKSMTAFGRGQATVNQGFWLVEIKTVNSRYLDFQLRAPMSLTGLEERLKKHVSTRLSRGRVNLSIRASGAAEPSPRLVLNRALVGEYKRVLEELRRELGLSGEPGLEAFLANRDLIAVEEAAPDMDQLWQGLTPALDAALEEVEAMRAAEGAALAKDLGERLDKLQGLFQEVAAKSPQIVEAYRQRLSQRVKELLEAPDPDPQRLALEVAILAEKCDVAEEVVRAQSHVAQFKDFLASPEPVGRKLDFLLQELNREANTMASKTPDAEAGRVIVEIKAELERIREQVQNIE